MKKTKEIPASWQYFHELVLAHQNGSDYTLTNLYEHAHCASDLPSIYKRLGWVAMGETPNFYRYLGPKSEKITPEMASLIRANWGKSKHKSISKPSQKSQKRQLRQDCANIAPANSITPKSPGLLPDCSRIADIPDTDLFAELKRRGWDIPSQLWKNTAP